MAPRCDLLAEQYNDSFMSSACGPPHIYFRDAASFYIHHDFPESLDVMNRAML